MTGCFRAKSETSRHASCYKKQSRPAGHDVSVKQIMEFPKSGMLLYMRIVTIDNSCRLAISVANTTTDV